jgi:magnesium transporter
VKNIYHYKDATWVDLVAPTLEEIAEVSKEYGLSQEVTERLHSPAARHTVEFNNEYAFIILHTPTFKDSENGDAANELDFVIGEEYVITARYGKIDAIEAHASSLESPNLFRMPTNARNVIFFGLLRAVIDSFDKKLVEIDHGIRETEQKIFSGHEKQTIFELSEASRHLIDFKKITAVWPDSFETVMEKGSARFGPEFAEFSAEIINTFEKSVRKLETLTEAVRELRDTNFSLLSTKQNELMKTMTIFSVIVAICVGIALTWLGYLAVK